jgi:predicted DsbA family dithiol-disulfide isomerase
VTRSFAITFDYLCPFARIGNEAVAEALDDGADWEVRYLPFSLAQAHVEDGEPDVWEREAGSPGTRGVTALQWGVAVRDHFPERFAAFHLGLFDARHSRAADVDDAGVLHGVARSAGLDPEAVIEMVESGSPLKTLAAEHREAVERWSVFGVPTFIAGDEAVFVRLMERHNVDDVRAVLDMLEWTRLNEFKRTTIPR